MMGEILIYAWRLFSRAMFSSFCLTQFFELLPIRCVFLVKLGFFSSEVLRKMLNARTRHSWKPSSTYHFTRGNFMLLFVSQNDDEDMIYMYNAYLHKLITSFLSHPLARDKVCHVGHMFNISVDYDPS